MKRKSLKRMLKLNRQDGVGTEERLKDAAEEEEVVEEAEGEEAEEEDKSQGAQRETTVGGKA